MIPKLVVLVGNEAEVKLLVILAEEEGGLWFCRGQGLRCPGTERQCPGRLRQQIPAGCEEGYSNSRTCEIGLSAHSGIPFRSLAYLVDHCYALF